MIFYPKSCAYFNKKHYFYKKIYSNILIHKNHGSEH